MKHILSHVTVVAWAYQEMFACSKHANYTIFVEVDRAVTSPGLKHVTTHKKAAVEADSGASWHRIGALVEDAEAARS